MRMQITATTDRQYLGHEFDASDDPIVLSDDVLIHIDKIVPLPGGARFISSNYIIDAKEV